VGREGSHPSPALVAPSQDELVKDAVANIMAQTGKSETAARAALVAANPQVQKLIIARETLQG
jgi:hypothetical protein